jgi:hypothetical protein
MLAPNSPQRVQVTALARQPTPPSCALLPAADPAQHAERSPARIPGSSPGQALWALLLARIYEILPLRCGLCGGEMRLIAFITDAPARHAILTCLGEPTTSPEVAPARGPPLWDRAPEPTPRWEDATLCLARPTPGRLTARHRATPQLTAPRWFLRAPFPGPHAKPRIRDPIGQGSRLRPPATRDSVEIPILKPRK